QQVYQTLNNANPDVRMRTISVLGAYAGAFATEKAPDAAKSKGQEFASTLERLAGNDPSPNVQAWAAYSLAALRPEPQRADIVSQLASYPLWQGKILAVTASRRLNKDAAGPLLDKLKGDPDPTVAHYAAATIDDLA